MPVYHLYTSFNTMKIGRIIAAVLLFATIFACGGSGNGTSTLKFAAPVVIQVPDNGTTTINGFASNGKMVGTFLINGSGTPVAYYWSSPTSAPSELIGSAVDAKAINEDGEIVGWLRTSLSSNSGVYWPSPTAPPTVLPNPPLPGNYAVATSINSQSQIVGTIDGRGVYWDASHANAITFKGPNNEDVYNCAIGDSGGIFATVQNSVSAYAFRPCYVPDIATSNVLQEILGSNIHTTYSRFATLNRSMGQAPLIDLDGSGVAFGSEILLDPTRAPFILPGINSYARYIGDDGKICGSRGVGASQVALIWGSGVSFPADLNNLTASTPDLKLIDALFQTADGSVIGKATQTSGGTSKEVYFFAQRLP